MRRKLSYTTFETLLRMISKEYQYKDMKDGKLYIIIDQPSVDYKYYKRLYKRSRELL